MKKVIVFSMFVLVFTGFFGSCGSIGDFGNGMVNDTTAAGIIVQGEDINSAPDNTQLYVVLDGKTIGTIASHELKGCTLKNGKHTIYFEYRGVPQGKSTPVNFTINNDRRHFKISFNIRDNGTYSEAVFNTAHQFVPVTVPDNS
jgi:hypothetical protein